MSNLVAEVPAHWAAAVRPFLQRAEEFRGRDPVVAYFLCTHVAFVCMQKRSKEDKEGTKFLMKLLDALENEKQRIGDALDGVDGRTVLTKIALMLFAKADDEERTGTANLSIVRLFYSSAVLFEATQQFTSDGQMDAVAAEKCKYAKYIASRMKKAIDSNQPYVSPNRIEAPLSDNGDGTNGMTTVAPSAYMPKQPSGTFAPTPATPPPPPPPAGNDLPPPYMQPSHMVDRSASLRAAQQQQQQQQQQPSAPSPVAPPKNSYTPPPVQPPQAKGRPAPQQSYAPPATGGRAPTPEEMIESQKFARQAVSALQFYDYTTARTQLIAALNMLDGKRA